MMDADGEGGGGLDLEKDFDPRALDFYERGLLAGSAHSMAGEK